MASARRYPYAKLGVVALLVLYASVAYLIGSIDGTVPNRLRTGDVRLSPRFRRDVATAPRASNSSRAIFNELDFEEEAECDGVCCRDIHKLLDFKGNENVSAASESDVCYFVDEIAKGDCIYGEGFFQYLRWVYCDFNADIRFLGMIINFLWLMFIFIGLATVADDFFCPCLAVISDSLHLSPNVAGVTFLAFGNGAPDIFSAVISVTSGGDPSLAFGSLFGAGVFVTTIVAGSVAIVNPFYAAERPLLRDIGFYLGTIIMTLLILVDGHFRLFEALVFVSLYIVYVITVVISHMVYSRQKARDFKVKKGSKSTEVELPSRAGNGADNVAFDGYDDPMVPAVNAAAAERMRHAHVYGKFTSAESEQGAVLTKYHVNEDVPIEFAYGARRKSSLLRRAQSADEAELRGVSFNIDDDEEPQTEASVGRNESLPDLIEDSTSNAEKATRARKYQRSASANNLEDDSPSKRRKSTIDKFATSVRRMSKSTLSKSQERLASLAIAANSGEQGLHMLRVRKPRPRKAVKDTLRVVENLTAVTLLSNRIMPPPPRASRANLLDEKTLDELEQEEEREAAEEDEAEMLVFEGPWYKLLWHGVNPIDMGSFQEMGILTKIYEIIKAPILFILLLSTPRVDSGEPLHLWNRPLNSLHMMLSPVFATLLFMKFGLETVFSIGSFDVPLALLVGIAGTPFAILLFVTSSNRPQPRFHWVLAYVGFLVALTWIYALVTEVVNVIQTFGTYFAISNALLGLTVLAWGNSIGDYIANLIMSKQGFPRMAISACYGAPLLNVLLGLGVPFTIKTISEGNDIELDMTIIEVIMVFFLVFSLVSALIIAPSRKFFFDRYHGFFLVITYFVFLTLAILAERKVIPDVFRKDKE